VHFDFTITLQGMLTIGICVAGFFRIERKLMWFMIEHEILISDYLKRNNLKAADLPTRAHVTK
jgi:hypothetical protein